MDTSLLAKWSELGDQIKDLKQRAAALEEEQDALEREIRDQFVAEETQSINRNGQLYYLHRTLCTSVAPGRQADLETALREMGHDDLFRTTLNSQTFSAFIRDLETERRTIGTVGDEWLPEPLRPLVRLFERIDLRSKKA